MVFDIAHLLPIELRQDERTKTPIVVNKRASRACNGTQGVLMSRISEHEALMSSWLVVVASTRLVLQTS